MLVNTSHHGAKNRDELKKQKIRTKKQKIVNHAYLARTLLAIYLQCFLPKELLEKALKAYSRRRAATNIASAASAASGAARAIFATSATARSTVRKLTIGAVLATRASVEEWARHLWHFGR